MPAIKSFIDKYIYHKQENVPPPITTNTATALLIVYTLIYVVPFYLSPRTRPSPDLSRDAPSVIRARIASVTLTCVVCSAATFYVLTNQGRAPALDAAHLMGYLPVGLVEAGKTTLLTAILFAGPLFEHLVVEGAWRDWLRLAPLRELFNEWTVWRNIGPVTEEVLFRSAAVPLMLLARTSIPKTIFLSPVIFGLAHVHHFYEFRITHRQVPLAAALARSAFQLAYTTLFGAYATFLFLRTGSLLAICLVHAFCNCMGLPRVWGCVQPPGGEGGDDDVAVAVAPREGGERGSSATTAKRPTLLWTVAYYCLLVGGALTWYRNLWRLTTSPQALVPMDGW